MAKDILVVEDDAVSQFVIVEMCHELGFRCLTASDGNEAVEMATSNAETIGLILMDIHLPNTSGLEATQMIRSSQTDPPKNVPVIATTADYSWHDKRRCIEFGFNGVMPKPLNFEVLESVLSSYS